LCPFYEITGFTLILLEKVLRSENSEENSEESIGVESPSPRSFWCGLRKVETIKMSVRNCAGISNNSVPRGAKVSAIDVTVTHKHSLSICICFQDWAHLGLESTVRVLPHLHRTHNNYFSISLQIYSPNGPSLFFVSTIHQVIWPSPGTLHPMLFIPDSNLICFFHVETQKVSTSTFYYTSHDMNRFIPHINRTRPLNGIESGLNLAENRIKYVLPTT